MRNTSALRYLISFLWTTLLPVVIYGQRTNDFANSMQMLQLVNNARLQKNIRPLCLSEKLVRSATAHSTYQASINTMTHDGPVSLGDRFVRQGYQPSAVAENVGFTSTPFIQVVFDIWMSSPEHRANILDPNYVHFGAASSHGTNNMYFWTQLFAKPLSLVAEPCDFSGAATAAALTPGQQGFNPNGSWGGSSNYNAYTPGMTPSGNCVSVDDGRGGKSLSCKLGGPAGPKAIPYTSPGSNSYNPAIGPNVGGNQYNPALGPYPATNQYNPANGANQYNPANGQMQYNPGYTGTNTYNPIVGSNPYNSNPMTNPVGPSVINNPPGYTGNSCSVVSTSPAPDGQGSVRVLRCAPGTPGVGTNTPNVQPVAGGNTMVVNPDIPNGYNGYNDAGSNTFGYNAAGGNAPPGHNPNSSYNPAGFNIAAVNSAPPAAAPVNGVYSPFWN